MRYLEPVTRSDQPVTSEGRQLESTTHSRWFTFAAMALLLFSQAVYAEKPIPGITARVTRPVHPILIRNKHGPLLRILIQVDPGTQAHLNSLTFQLQGTNDLKDLDSLSLFATGEKAEFSPAVPIGPSLSPVAPSIIFPVDQPLREGPNHFWLSCRLNDSASILHSISATCSAVATSPAST